VRRVGACLPTILLSGLLSTYPGMNRIIFHEDDLLASLVDNSSFYMTMLTEWFVANRDHTDATSLTYLDFPRWVWDASNRLGRIYHVHPVTRELFFFPSNAAIGSGQCYLFRRPPAVQRCSIW
jgi:hypothetical protein